MYQKKIFILSLFVFLISTSAKSIVVKNGQAVKVSQLPQIDSVVIGDLLAVYAQKPEGLILIESTAGKFQTKSKAVYRVEGVEAGKKVEEFLIQHYQMGRLKFACCGWESGAKLGQFSSEKLKAIDPYCSMIITMHSTEILEQDRNKVKILFVVVEVVVI